VERLLVRAVTPKAKSQLKVKAQGLASIYQGKKAGPAMSPSEKSESKAKGIKGMGYRVNPFGLYLRPSLP
jgi:hypothetical protein